MSYNFSITRKQDMSVANTTNEPFGKVPTNHMFIAEYRNGEWHNPRIEPMHDLTLSPLALCLHYGQTVFEGMKAFKFADGRVNIFRVEKHHDRFCKSLDRMCMPPVSYELFRDSIRELVNLDRDWVPADGDGSLYLRPFMIATEARIGASKAEEYLYMVLASPAYQYYSAPLKIKVERNFTRAADGGTGAAKCGGNYGGAFYPTQKAREEGFDQVLWTDNKHHETIEESGTMNAMFYFNNTLVTPALSGSILDGVTRDSMLTIARETGIHVEERSISITELKALFDSGTQVEAFGAGTAAVVAPIKSITIDGKEYACYLGEDAVMFKLKSALFNIRKGLAPDTHGWNLVI